MATQETALKAHLDYCLRSGEDLRGKVNDLLARQDWFFKILISGMGAIAILLLANLLAKVHY